MSLSDDDKKNFDTLCRAIRNGDAALLHCDRKDGKPPSAVIVAVEKEGDSGYRLIPFAVMLDEDPYEIFIPPVPAEWVQCDEDCVENDHS